jgi:hypothetical protein
MHRVGVVLFHLDCLAVLKDTPSDLQQGHEHLHLDSNEFRMVSTPFY